MGVGFVFILGEECILGYWCRADMKTEVSLSLIQNGNSCASLGP